ncbi:MAG: hypothetical protein S4CHLAM102_13910 [Chlamydiia bacterium]|nr:hypothetical protein [Chlamydiia bacterium]
MLRVLQKLNLSKNPLGDQGGKELLPLLTHLSDLELKK